MAMRAVVYPCALFGLLICAAPARAQYRFDHWTTDNGLPQNSVRDILQTRDGYLWLTTFDGLARFDGVRFTVFNKSNSPGLASNRFLQLFEDRSGDLWASLETGGLVRRHEGRFTTYTKGQGLPFDGVPALSDDGQGNLIISWGKRLFRWRDGQFQPADEPLPSANQPPDEGRDRTHLLPCWQDNRKLFCFVVGQALSWTETELPASQFFRAAKDDQGNIWISTLHSLIRVRDGRVAQVYTERHGLPGMNPGLVMGKRRPLQAISRDATGGLWLTDLDSMQSRIMSAHPPEGLDTYISYADNEGNYWFRTISDGLFRARKQTVTAYTKAQGLNASEVYTLLEGRDGSLWIGASGDGLFRFKDGAFTNYAGADSFRGRVSSLYEDHAGQLWVNGVWRLTKGGFVRELWKDVDNGSLGEIWTMCEDRAGAYWIGSAAGVVRYQNGVATLYTTKDGLAGADTKVIIPDTAGGLWLGSYGGLTHYKDGKFTAWTEKDGLPGSTVRALKQDGDGTLWIGTYDSGLGRFKDGRFTRYTQKDGLYDDGVFQILEEDYGWFWMSCNRGVYRARKQELNDFADGKIKTITALAYNKSDGMPSAECNGGRWPAGIKTRDGKLWFPTMGGVAVIDPASVRTNTQPPPVVIEEMRINNQPVALESWEPAIRNHPQDKAAIRVEPGQENFEIQYTALSFINSENLRFKYKLEGADHDWVEAGARRTAYYSHVSPGAYTFTVIAANSDGVWNTEGRSLRIIVLPPFYLTWWFLSLAILTVGGAIFAVFKYRVAQIERRQAAQQAFARQLIASQENERKRIAGELHDSLGQSLVIIRNWALLGADLLEPASPAKEELDEISGAASRAINEVREIAYNLGPYHIERLGLANSIQDMVKRVAQISGVNITTELDPLNGALSRETEMSLYRITQEALNNMFKHSQATEARVSLKREAAGVRLTISDNGNGFNLQPGASPDNSRNGFGLTGIAERVRLMGGGLAIHSAAGQGATIEVVLSDNAETAK